jgi:hypothetical protein
MFRALLPCICETAKEVIAAEDRARAGEAVAGGTEASGGGTALASDESGGGAAATEGRRGAGGMAKGEEAIVCVADGAIEAEAGRADAEGRSGAHFRKIGWR